jgi:hypothetical protein
MLRTGAHDKARQLGGMGAASADSRPGSHARQLDGMGAASATIPRFSYFMMPHFPFLFPAQHNGFVGTGSEAEVATVATAGINEGRLIRVQLDDGLALANSAGQALAAGVTKFIHHMGDGRHLGFGGLYY